jgi:hypothetical protein
MLCLLWLTGFFVATIIAHYLTPKPLALLSFTGIPTFRHQWFNSSVLIPTEPIKEDEVEHLLAEPVTVGTTPPSVFHLDMLLPSGAKNPGFEASSQLPFDRQCQDPNRGLLYDYFLHGNDFLAFVDSVDAGFSWATDATNSKLDDWPSTIFIQGDNDEDVDKDVCISVAKSLGPKAKLIIAQGQGHLFEGRSFIEDKTPGMDAIRLAIRALEDALTAMEVVSSACKVH